MSHTPGPWEIRKPKGPHDRAIVEHEIVGTYESPFVGAKEIKICGIHNQIEANVKLIAASPDLLEALELLLKSVSEREPFTDAGMWEHKLQRKEAEDKARAAIAKAKGEL